MADVRNLLGGRRSGRLVSPQTLHRWYSKGMRGVRLRTEVHGGIRVTSRAWIDEFFGALKAARDGDSPASVQAPVPRSPAQRQKASALAGAELDSRMRRAPAAAR
jgi:hypothetical protein